MKQDAFYQNFVVFFIKYIMERFTIINADCLEAMRELESESVDFIFADPPYWMRVSGILKRVEGTDYNGCNDDWDNAFNSLKDYTEFTAALLGEAKRLLKKMAASR